MALFSVNQNGQWFTVKGRKAYDTSLSADGDIRLEGNTTAKKMWFEYLSKIGGKNLIKRSEVINLNNGGSVTIALAEKMKHTAKYIKLSMNSNVNSGDPVVGQIYGLYINQRNYHALGDNQFGELGAEVRANPGATTSTLMRDLAVSFYNNLGSDQDLYKVYLEKNASGTLTLVEVVGANGAHTVDTSAYSDTYQAIFIAEREQDWIQGTMQRENVNLNVADMFLSNITLSTFEHDDWGTLTEVKKFDASTAFAEGEPVNYNGTLYETKTGGHSASAWDAGDFTTTSHTVGSWVNTKDIADMEWFYLGEHGDQQRLMGYPYANAATITGDIYKVINDDNGYDLITIHHNYTGNGTFVQKSEQDIIIACSAASSHTIAKAILNDIHDYISDVPATDNFPSVNTTYTF